MFALIPLVAWALLSRHLLSSFPGWGWRRSLLRATVIAGVYGVILLELLSVARLVSHFSLILAWGMPSIVLAILIWSQRSYHTVSQPTTSEQSFSILESASLSFIALIVVATAITAWFAPPNTYDSLTYHMSRVAHWAQEGGVVPYASGILRQNYMSPGAEMGILHLYLLGQGDRLANFVQWGAMVISLVGVSLVASDLDVSRRGQIFAALFAATLPVGIAQASSTMTDYVTALWVLITVSEVLAFTKQHNPGTTLPLAAFAAGLAILTKQHAVAFLAPFAVLVLVHLIRDYPLKHALRFVALSVAIVTVLNAGFLVRNMLVFGSVLGTGRQIAYFTNEIFNLKVFISNLLRNASLHAGTPWPAVNQGLYSLLAKVHWKLGLDLTETGTSLEPFFTIWGYPPNESRSTNTIQALLILVAIGVALWRWKRVNRAVLKLGAASLLGFIIYASVFKFYIIGGRYHMPFFILIAPPVAAVFDRRMNAWLLSVLSVVMAIGALPILFKLESRPLIPSDKRASVLTEERVDQYFVQARNLEEFYVGFADQIRAAECTEVAVQLLGDSPEYPFWVLMGAPRSDVVIRWIIAEKDPSGAFRPRDYSPCAVICEACGWQGVTYNDLPLRAEDQNFRLYLK